MKNSVKCLRPKTVTLQIINQKNRQFWLRQGKLTDRRMSDKALLRVAVNDISSQTSRGIPVAWQKNFDVALADAESARDIVHQEHSRKNASLQNFSTRHVSLWTKWTGSRIRGSQNMRRYRFGYLRYGTSSGSP
jgi:hypothetical protein